MGSLRDERGASAVEFALIVVVLFLVLFGTIQFGIAFHRDQGIEAAAREGARLASIGATVDQITDRVKTAQSLFDEDDVVVTITPSGDPPCNTAGRGNPVTVTVTVPPPTGNLDKYAISIPFWNNVRITYTATGTFRCERGNL
jgi:Flp pilus assembly protein TadG